jgi:NAD(P)-dependent dehydrogenase (short-subunit alcohol dehydrogenase family)
VKEEFFMNLSFENQVALVTGAGSGLGLATAKAFAEAGASVTLADNHQASVRAASGKPYHIVLNRGPHPRK